MTDKNRIAYLPEVEKMKGLKPDQSAIVKFNGAIENVEIEFENRNSGMTEVKNKLHFPILLFTHPTYNHLDSEVGVEMIWETECSEAKQLAKALPELAQTKDPDGISKHFKSGRWEIYMRNDGKIKLFMLKL